MTEVICAQHLAAHYGNFRALTDVSLSIDSGQIVGLLGPNGAGKTTLLKAVLGLNDYSGELSLLGCDPRKKRVQLLQDMCFIADVAILPRWLEVRQALEFVAAVHPKFSYSKAFNAIKQTDIQFNARISQLSKGMIVQLHLSLVMAIDAKILVLDEPTLGLDIVHRKAFYSHLLNDYYDSDKTIVITTHQVEEIEHILTHIVFIDHGKIKLNSAMENLAQQFYAIQVDQDKVAALAALKPIYSESALGQTRFIFENVDVAALRAYGEVSTPSVSDIFVAKIKGDAA